jgi:phosphonate transport system substrate-binding protein
MIQALGRSFSLRTMLTTGPAKSCGVALLLLGGMVPPAGSADTAISHNAEPVRFAFSSRMFSDVNENDAKASIKAWALALARERHVPMNAEPIILSGIADLKQSLRSRSIDGAAVTTEEYLSLEPELQGTNLFMSFTDGRFTETYLLLVHADSGISDLRGLRGRSVVCFDNARMSLAPLWLDTILSEQEQDPAAAYFGQRLKASKLAKVVLPVFFHQQDACLVTRRGFETMCELNPQVRAQIRVLITSPELVPTVGFLRRDYDSPLRNALLTALRGVENSAAGTQVLTLFQIDQFQEAPASLLNTARKLVAAHRHLKQVAAGETRPSGQPSLNAEVRHDPAPQKS